MATNEFSNATKKSVSNQDFDLIYTVPDDEKSLVFCITVANKADFDEKVTCLCRKDGEDINVFVNAPVPSGGTLAFREKIVLLAGTEVLLKTNVSSESIDCIISMFGVE
jgi:hypothetical protein